MEPSHGGAVLIPSVNIAGGHCTLRVEADVGGRLGAALTARRGQRIGGFEGVRCNPQTMQWEFPVLGHVSSPLWEVADDDFRGKNFQLVRFPVKFAEPCWAARIISDAESIFRCMMESEETSLRIEIYFLQPRPPRTGPPPRRPFKRQR